MDITLTINASLEHVEGTPYLSKEEIVAAICETITDPSVVGKVKTGAYTTTVWDVEEA